MAYIAIYLNTPQDLDWHLITSFDRLMVHLFPTLVFEITRLAREQNESDSVAAIA